MSERKVKLDIQDGVAVITLNDPSALNAVSPPMLEALADALTDIEAPDSGVRCVIMTGEGRGFSAGANLQGRGEQDPNPNARPDSGSLLEQMYHPIMRRIRNLEMPFLTAVNGPAAGVGMSFAMMGDLILAGESAYFMQAFRRIGLVPDGGATYLLPRLVGFARARELSLLGEKLPAKTAMEWGLVNRVYPDDQLMDEAMAMAKDLATGPTVALGKIRMLYNQSALNSYEEQLDLERQTQKIAGRTDDFGEGVKAFLEKRPAEFKGK
jgi:2-(1,2-epoxy-1,2-dihydrophenyl)acetyl-CoA isomerase